MVRRCRQWGDALAAIDSVGAEFYAIAQPDVPDGQITGEPNTFIWAYRGPVEGTADTDALSATETTRTNEACNDTLPDAYERTEPHRSEAQEPDPVTKPSTVATVTLCLVLGLATTGCGLVIEAFGDSDGSEEEAAVSNATTDAIWLVADVAHYEGRAFMQVDGGESELDCVRGPGRIEVHTSEPDGQGDTPVYTVEFGDRDLCSGAWEWDGTALFETAAG